MHPHITEALSLLNGFVYPATVTGLLQSFAFDPEAQEMIHLSTGTVLENVNADSKWSVKHV